MEDALVETDVEELVVVGILVDDVEDALVVLVEPLPPTRKKAPADARTMMITTIAIRMIWEIA